MVGVRRGRQHRTIRSQDSSPSIGGRAPLTVRRAASKILTREAARSWRAHAGGSVVFTNGVFDVLHPGHVNLLESARAEGDALVVGLNSDESVRRLKGPSRPVRAERERAAMLAALECVDAVVPFSEDTPLALIRELKPDVLVKGGDYDRGTIVGGDDVERWGGRVAVVPLTPGHSTTSFLERMRTQGG